MRVPSFDDDYSSYSNFAPVDTLPFHSATADRKNSRMEREREKCRTTRPWLLEGGEAGDPPVAAHVRKLSTVHLALRQGGTRQSEIKIESPIYDTIGEDEYKNLVDKRRDDFKSFIVDDNGLGYGDEGEEEDWTKAGAPPLFGNKSDGKLERTKRKKTEKESFFVWVGRSEREREVWAEETREGGEGVDGVAVGGGEGVPAMVGSKGRGRAVGFSFSF